MCGRMGFGRNRRNSFIAFRSKYPRTTASFRNPNMCSFPSAPVVICWPMFFFSLGMAREREAHGIVTSIAYIYANIQIWALYLFIYEKMRFYFSSNSLARHWCVRRVRTYSCCCLSVLADSLVLLSFEHCNFFLCAKVFVRLKYGNRNSFFSLFCSKYE